MKGIVFEVTYKSGNKQKFVSKSKKHHATCLEDLKRAKELGAVIGWTESNPKSKEIQYHA